MHFRDLILQYQNNKTNLDNAIQSVLDSGAFINGPQVMELEEALASYVGRKYCITCANGTDALFLALMVLNIESGHAVFVPAFTFFSTAEAVSRAGAFPIFVDVDETFNMDPFSLREAVKEVKKEGKLTAKAVITVDLFGQPANYPVINKIVEEENLFLIEDGAQGFGGRIKDKHACSFGDISTTSFFPMKPLGCYGDGGAVFTDKEELAFLISSLKNHGKGSDKYENIHIGLNSRLDTLQAAILLEKLKLFAPFELDQSQKAADLYTSLLSAVVKTPVIKEDFKSSWAQYSILLHNNDERNNLQTYLSGRKIPSMVYYPRPLHMQPVYSNKLKTYVSLKNAEDFSSRILSLPMHPYLNNEEISYICKEIECFYNLQIIGKFNR